MHSGLILVTFLLSASVFGKVTIDEKKNKVHFLEKIGAAAPSLSIDAYKRELEYEKRGLPLEDRASREANLLAERIRTQVYKAYKAALKDKQDQQAAVAEVRDAIAKDLELADPTLRPELETLASEALESAQAGGISVSTELRSLEKIMLQDVIDRAQYLNQSTNASFGIHDRAAFEIPGSKENLKPEYDSREELVESLVSGLENSRWVGTSNMSARTAEIREQAARINLQVQIEFLGVSVEAGPKIAFRREYVTQALVIAEGLTPVLMNDGNFDFYQRDDQGKIIKENGTPKKRFIAFFCDATLNFKTEYTGGGGFRVAGVGAEASVSKTYSNSVTLSSRRIYLPEYVEKKSVTMQLLSEICHNDFLKAKINPSITVSDSLNVMMKNLVSGLRYSHPKTKCSVDRHCFAWYNYEVLALLKAKNYPRCVVGDEGQYNTCTLRGLPGQNCTVIENGKRVSDGMFEYTCDVGLKCVKVKSAGWFKNGSLYQPAKGVCTPINPSTYRNPFDRNYIEVRLVN